MYKIKPDSIYEYNLNGSILPKTKFQKNEKGIFGIFHEFWCDKSYNNHELIIFAPQRENDFDAPENIFQNIRLPNHRFLKYISEQIPAKRIPTQEDIDKTYTELKYWYAGGFEGNYNHTQKVLHITSLWRGENSCSSCFDKLKAKTLCEQLIQREDINLKKFKIKKGLHKIVY